MKELKDPGFAAGLLAGNEFGQHVATREERLRIRRLVAPHLDSLRDIGSVSLAPIIAAIDAATRSPRKARGKR